jgi:hypothetical protein
MNKSKKFGAAATADGAAQKPLDPTIGEFKPATPA